ncbi:MAG: hypothetical protein AAF666_09680 [Pseudomonadota bacterium]
MFPMPSLVSPEKRLFLAASQQQAAQEPDRPAGQAFTDIFSAQSTPATTAVSPSALPLEAGWSDPDEPIYLPVRDETLTGEDAANYRSDTRVHAVYYSGGQIIGAVFADGDVMLHDVNMSGWAALKHEARTALAAGETTTEMLHLKLREMLHQHQDGHFEEQMFAPGTAPTVDDLLTAWADGERVKPVKIPLDYAGAVDHFERRSIEAVIDSSAEEALAEIEERENDPEDATGTSTVLNEQEEQTSADTISDSAAQTA